MKKTNFDQMVASYHRLLEQQGLEDAAPTCGRVRESYYGTDSMNFFWYRMEDTSYRDGASSESRAMMLAAYPMTDRLAKKTKKIRFELGIGHHEDQDTRSMINPIRKRADDIKQEGHKKCASAIEEELFKDYLIQISHTIHYETFFKGRAGEESARAFRQRPQALEVVKEADKIEYSKQKIGEPGYEGVLDTGKFQLYSLVFDGVAAIVLNKDVSKPIIARYGCTFGSALSHKGINGRVFLSGINKQKEVQTAQILLETLGVIQ
jgi:hypothetical protein